MSRGRILIVDHETGAANALRTALCARDFTVWYAREGREALSLLWTVAPDVILLDIWLPGMDGFELLEALRQGNPETAIIVMSAYGNVQIAVKALKLGAFDYVEKPVALDQLLGKIHQALQQQARADSWEHKAIETLPLSYVLKVMPQSQSLWHQLEQAWSCNKTVLLQGEVGSGRTLLARLLHDKSPHNRGPFIRCACAALADEDAEALLFGLGQKSTNGHRAATPSYLELANGGTIFLHNVDLLPFPAGQHRLWQALHTCMVSGKAGRAPLPLNIRIIASCITPLHRLCTQGRFLPELAMQLQGIYIEVPPLRARRREIPGLIQHLLRLLSSQHGHPPKAISTEALRLLCEYDWPGNLIELYRTLARMVTTTAAPRLTVRDLPPLIRQQRTACRVATTPQGKGSQRALLGNIRPAGPSRPQRTLRRSVVLYGQGLQSGIKTGLILVPLPPHSGIIFRDVVSGETVPASVDCVKSTTFCTSLRKGHTVVRTVEHLLSALHAYGVTNLLIKYHGEIPIMDGSAETFCWVLEETGLEDQSAPVEELVIRRCYQIGSPQPHSKHLILEPYEGLRITYRLHCPQPIGIQEVSYEHRNGTSYREEIAPARTFAFVREVERLHEQGLVAGGRLNNVILLDEGRLLTSTRLRFPDEFARHKILDIMGDLYLLGFSIRGHVRANMTGHTENIALVRQLRRLQSAHTSACG